MKLNHSLLAARFGLVALAVTATFGAHAQRIPASSSDSGRRAVVAIDQATINNNINNAQNTANYGVAVGNNAQNTANYAVAVGGNAQGTADWAARMAQDAASRPSYGSAIASWSVNNTGNSGWSASGLCLQGWDPNGAAQYTSGAPVCPAGSGPFIIFAVQNSGGQGE
ncbi:hypothetical protein QMO14_30945 [Variovorax sp. CAN2819]|uniref:hypothetical protein n=1 Tax=Variovorax sp. CAN15 TaxID=3046727 RepID=UPI00264A401D|nr:hypothetical protein [Variovorax sp. CAN15]MDN6888000.1 hypothetical protein [Variovorax sp. CAN15]